MYNPRNENELELSRFGEYLLRTRIATERHAPYGRNRLAGWSIPFAFAPHLRSEADHGAGLRQTATEQREGRGFREEEEAGFGGRLAWYTLSYTGIEASVRLGVRGKWPEEEGREPIRHQRSAKKDRRKSLEMKLASLS